MINVFISGAVGGALFGAHIMPLMFIVSHSDKGNYDC